MSHSTGFRWVVLVATAFTQVLPVPLVYGQGIVMPQKETQPGAPQYTVEQQQYLAEKTKVLATINAIKGQNLADATSRCFKVLELDRQVFGEKSLPAADTLEVLALLLWSAPDYENAVVAKFEIAGIYKEIYGKDDWRTGLALWMAVDWKISSSSPELPQKRADVAEILNTAKVHLDAGRYKEALATAEKANEVSKVIFKDDPDVPVRAGALLRMADAYSGLNRFNEATKLYEESEKIFSSWYGEANPDSVRLIMSHGDNAYDSFQSERLYWRAVELCEKMTSYDRNLLATALSKLAGVQRNMGRYAQGRATLERAIQVSSELNGAESSKVMALRVILGSIDRELGKLEEAEQELKRMTTYFDAAPADLIVDRIIAHQELGIVYVDQKRWDLAEKEFRTTLDLNKKRFGEDLFFCKVLSRIGVVEFRAGRYDKAAATFEKCLAKSRALVDPTNQNVILYAENLSQTLRQLANDLNKKGKRADAKARLQHAVKVAVPVLGENHPETIRVTTALVVQDQIEQSSPEVVKVILDAENEAALGGVAVEANNLVEAEQHFRRAIELRESLGDKQLPYVTASSNLQLGQLLRKQEKWADSLVPLAKAQAAYDEVYLGKQPSMEYGDAYYGAGDSAEKISDYATAIKNFNRSIEIYGRLEGSEANNAIKVLGRVANCLGKSGDHTSALTACRRYVEEVKRINGTGSPEYAEANFILARTEFDLGNYAAAREHFSQSREIRKALGETTSASMLSLSQWLASCEKNLGNHEAAIGMYEPLLVHYGQTNDEEGLASISGELAKLYARQNRFDDAVRLAEENVALAEKIYGNDAARTGKAWDVLRYVTGLHIYDIEAALQLTEAVAAREKLLASLSARSDIDSQQVELFKAELEELKRVTELPAGKQKTYADALATVRKIPRLEGPQDDRSLAIQLEAAAEQLREVLGDDALSLALALEFAATTSNNSQKSVAYLREALKIYPKIFGEGSVKCADAHAQLGSLFSNMGDYQAAVAELEQAREFYLNNEGVASHWRGAAEINLANAYLEMGDLAQAQEFLTNTGRLLAAAPDFQTSLNLLHVKGQLAGKLGNYDELVRLRKAEYDQTIAHYGEDSYQAVSVNINMGDALVEGRRPAEARPYYERARALLEAKGETGSVDYARIINGLASVYQHEGNLAEAEKLLRQARDIFAAEFGVKSPWYRLALYDLAEVLLTDNQLDEAEQLLRESLALGKQVGAERTKIHQASLIKLARALLLQNKNDEAADLTQEALLNHERMISSTTGYQTESEQAAAMSEARGQLGWHLYATQSISDRQDEAYDHVLWLKGSIFARQRRLRELRDDPAAAELLSRWTRVTSELSTLIMRPPYADEQLIWSERVTALVAEKDSIERSLLGMSQTNPAPPATTAEVRKALPANSALVDFFFHEAASTDAEGKKITTQEIRVFIVRPDRPEVSHVVISNSAKLNELINTWREALEWQSSEKFAAAVAADDEDALNEMFIAAQRTQRDTAAAIKEQLWKPLESHLEGVETVIVSPDGPISKFPLAALPGSSKAYLIEEQVITSIAVPSLLPELLASRGDAEAESLLLMGDVNYGGSAGIAQWRDAQVEADVRGWLRYFFSPLEGVRPEMEDIKSFFAKAFPDGEEDMFTESDASENMFRMEAPKHRWVHLATHGFFKPDIANDIAGSDSQRPLSADASSTSDYTAVLNHEGLKSGLALAGANEANRDGEDDGILSAMEVSSMDLSGVEMTMLSACQTGLGNSMSGEGVAGLQRALQMAGVRSTVTTLWSVDDTAARLLAARFYRNLWEHKMSKAAAMREAQSWMIAAAYKDDGDSEIPAELTIDSEVLPGRFRLPDCWAPFVLSGDWR